MHGDAYEANWATKRSIEAGVKDNRPKAIAHPRKASAGVRAPVLVNGGAGDGLVNHGLVEGLAPLQRILGLVDRAEVVPRDRLQAWIGNPRSRRQSVCT